MSEFHRAGAVASILYVTGVASGLYLPPIGDPWGWLSGHVFTYSGFPLAIASATQAGLRPRTLRTPWDLWLAFWWAIGAALLCAPQSLFDDPVREIVVRGASLSLVAAALLCGVALGVGLNRLLSPSVRILYGGASLALPVVLLVEAVLWLKAIYFGPLWVSEAMRVALLALAVVVALSAIVAEVESPQRPPKP